MKRERSLSMIHLDLADVERPDTAPLYNEEYTGCLLHGFGASANDLVGLAPVVGAARRWIFPHAPIPITVAGMSYGRAWFPRETETMEQALMGTYFQNLRAMEPDGLTEAANAIRELIDDAGVSWDKLILGGFSQGAIVSAEILRQGLVEPTLPVPRALLLFSGSLIAERWWDEVPEQQRSLPLVFQSHGTHDTVLPFDEGRALATKIADAGCDLTFVEFADGHTIPAAAYQHAATFLSERLSYPETDRNL
jgi:phospholipase/carboxylesterase